MPMNQIFNIEDIEKKILLILRILNESPEPVGARLISRRMQDHGVTLSERGVRYHLKLMDDRGLTRLIGRHDGRAITEQGIEEIANARVHDKIGFAISRIEILAFRTSLDLDRRQGLIPVNVSFFPRKSFKKALELMKPAFSKGLCVSELVACADEGDRIGEMTGPGGIYGFRHGLQHRRERHSSEERRPDGFQVRRHSAGQGRQTAALRRIDQLFRIIPRSVRGVHPGTDDLRPAGGGAGGG